MALLIMALFVNPTTVELSVWIGDVGCGHTISIRVLRRGTFFLLLCTGLRVQPLLLML